MARGPAALLFALALGLALEAGGQPGGSPAKSLSDTALSRPPQAPQDSLARPKLRADTVLVPKHTFNHREQIIAGSVVMSCLLLILVAMNNYNPR